MTSKTKVQMAVKVQARGVPELSLAVMADRITLTDACWLADCQLEIQHRLLEYPDSTKARMSALIRVLKERQRQAIQKAKDQGQIPADYQYRP